MSETAFEVTFKIAVPDPGLFPRGDDQAPATARQLVEDCAEVVRKATGIAKGAAGWTMTREELTSGRPVRVRMSALQFARFFVLRRAAPQAVAHRLKWKDATEVEA